MKNISRILVVEDEEAVRSNIAEILEAEEFLVEQAENGIDAIQKIEKSLPDLIVSDVMMPGIDGYDLVRYIQNNPLTLSIPIILLTARAEMHDLRRGMQYGADDYITKPFKAQDLINAVNTRLKKQKNVNKKFDDLKSNISMYIPHELRTPLFSILGFADLIMTSLDDLDKNEIKQMAAKVKKAGIRLYERIEKFLYFSELELNKSSIQSNESSLVNREFVQCTLNTKFKDRGTEVIKLDIEEGEIKLSHDYFVRILVELIDNAYKFSKGETMISVTAKKENSDYVLTVEDNGIGLTEMDIKQIGTPFKQLNREEFQQEGNGLGLAIVKNILSLAGGSLKIDSKHGKYSKFSVLIPLN